MKTSFNTKSILCLLIALALLVCAPATQAKSGSKAEKHAQKMQKALSHYKQGTLLHLEFNDNTECTGTVNTLSDGSFTFNNNETNLKESHNYSDVILVEKGKQYIGQGSVTKKRVPFGR